MGAPWIVEEAKLREAMGITAARRERAMAERRRSMVADVYARYLREL